MNSVYFESAKRQLTAPSAAMTAHTITVTDQPKLSVKNAIAYIEIAAPMYVHALQTPLAVAALPILANLPGRHEIKRKFVACIDAVISAHRTRQSILAHNASSVIRKLRGSAMRADMMKKISEPRVSLLKALNLCSAVARIRLRIANIGIIADSSVDSDASRPNTSE